MMTTGTIAGDYGASYLGHYSDTGEPYDWSSPSWREFFTNVARRLVEAVGDVGTALDVGCAKGLLVQALVAADVDAYGIDISDVMITSADETVAERLQVGSATDPIDHRYDLITCIEVLEHLSPTAALDAIDNICSATDRIVFSSTPDDFAEPTHINVLPTADWAAKFALRGFFRRVDVDLGFLSPWAVYFERADGVTARDLVHRYEGQLSVLRTEVLAKRTALLETQRKFAAAEEHVIGDLRHRLLMAQDNTIGMEAEAAQSRHQRDVATGDLNMANRELAASQTEVLRLTHELTEVHASLELALADLAAIRASERWRIGGAIVAPAAAFRRKCRS